VKKCTSCAKDLPDAAMHCVFCGTKQPAAPPAGANAKTVMGWQASDLLKDMAASGAQPAPGVAMPPPAAPPPAAPPPAAALGVAQTLALIPGTSRSFVTILAAMLLGCSLATAVEFSFLLGFVTLSAATVFELLQNGDTLVDTFGIASPLIGIVVAGITAFLSVKFMIDWLNKRGLAVFGWYRIAVGVAAIALIAGNRI